MSKQILWFGKNEGIPPDDIGVSTHIIWGYPLENLQSKNDTLGNKISSFILLNNNILFYDK